MSSVQLKYGAIQSKVTFEIVSSNYALRCDAKFAHSDYVDVDFRIRSGKYFQIGEFLPHPFVKGIQPPYLDQPTDESIPIINTLSIQNLSVNLGDCRHVTLDYFEEEVPESKKLRKGDVLLTVDGGVSIGKAVLFDIDGEYSVDSHVVILRPEGLTPLSLVYLLASPLGQKQFRRAESGASGQTTVTEDDIRRFIYPKSILKTIDSTSKSMESARAKIQLERASLDEKERHLWEKLDIKV